MCGRYLTYSFLITQLESYTIMQNACRQHAPVEIQTLISCKIHVMPRNVVSSNQPLKQCPIVYDCTIQALG